MYKFLLQLLFIASFLLSYHAEAGAFDNTLWLGNNKGASLGVLNVNRAGKVLRIVRDTEATGIAIDAKKNQIFFGGDSGQITARDLNSPALTIKTLNPPVVNGRDMAFDGKFLWRTDTGNRTVQKINPTTGAIVFSFEPAFYVVGIAWDGQNLWLSEYNGFLGNERIAQYAPNGKTTGVSFTTHLVDPLNGGFDLVGGLAFDSTDNTLWLGVRNRLIHYTKQGDVIGSVPITGSGRFIDGLEFQGVSACLIP
jgi:DNA-binding beta-propeller fold protein YncE